MTTIHEYDPGATPVEEEEEDNDDNNTYVPAPIEPTKRPKDTALKQQRLKSWQPILDPVWVIWSFFVLGGVFLPTGLHIQNMSDSLVEMKVIYDAHDDPDPICGINTTYNAGKVCNISFVTPKDMDPPIFVHYEIDNFYQNHRRYATSRDDSQLLGSLQQTNLAAEDCKPLNKLGDITLNPCGLIANTLFNDVIALISGTSSDGTPLEMIEDGIAWESDIKYKFAQPDGFNYERCPNDDCSSACCDGEDWSCTTPYEENGFCYRYFYPNDETTQYLYETYPMVVSPLDGVMNEHFIVWMRVAALPQFRKLYGWINQPIAANTRLTFTITANWVVESFDGYKALVVSTSNRFGGVNRYLGRIFLIIGIVCFALWFLFGMKHLLFPRRIADPKYLVYKED